MRYMLDTNIVSELIRNPAGPAAQRVRAASEDICVSVIVAAELRYGCAKKNSPRLRSKVEALLAAIPVLPFEPPADGAYAAIRSALEAAGLPIGANDLWIASHARMLGATMVTANVNEFSRVPGLKVENWLA